MSKNVLITGATGFAGSHVADAYSAQGHRVVALARAGSDVRHLDALGARIVSGDLTDEEALRDAVEGVDVVVHCAAKVGDWGPVDDYRTVNVEGTRRLLDACRDQSLTRFVHLSSLGVYAARHHYGTTEDEPLPALHMDGYTQTKVESEQLALSYHRDHGVPVTVLRPGFIYGPRDRTVLPTIVRTLAAQQVMYISGGKAVLNSTYVGNLVEAVRLAAEVPAAVGQVYNITDGERVTKRQFFEAIADGLGLPRPKRSVPLWLARWVAAFMEGRARRRQSPVPPRLTQARLKFLGLNLDYSIEKARRELGYQPKVGFADGMRETLHWFQHRDQPAAEPATVTS